MSDSKKYKIKPQLSVESLNARISSLKEQALALAGLSASSTDFLAEARNHLAEVAGGFATGWGVFESQDCGRISVAVEQIRQDMSTFNGQQLADEADTAIQNAEEELKAGLHTETADYLSFNERRKQKLEESRTELGKVSNMVIVQKIRTCGDNDAPLDPMSGNDQLAKAILEVLLVGAAIGVEVMIGIKAQQHGSNLMTAIGITIAMLMVLFTTTHYGMCALKRIVSHKGFNSKFEKKYLVHDDGYRYDRDGRLVDLADLDRNDMVTAFACLFTCLATCLFVVGYRFMAVAGSSLAETANLGAIMMVMLTFLFAIEKYHFASKYNEDEFSKWMKLTSTAEKLKATIAELQVPNAVAKSKFRAACDELEKKYLEVVKAATNHLNEQLEALNNSRNYALTLLNDYTRIAREFVEIHYRETADAFVSSFARINAFDPATLGLTFGRDIQPMLTNRMVLGYNQPELRQQIENFRFHAQVSGNLVIEDFSTLEAEIDRKERAKLAAAAQMFRAEN